MKILLRIDLFICLGLSSLLLLQCDRVPGGRGPIRANPDFARGNLKQIYTAQEMIKRIKIRDSNKNGAGEYGDTVDLWKEQCQPFLELKIRLWSEEAREINRKGSLSIDEKAIRKTAESVEYGGYLYKVYIPENPDDAERYWCAYTWPAQYGVTGEETFFITEQKKIYMTKDPTYSGSGHGPPVRAAYQGEPFKSPINTSRWTEVIE